MKAPPDKDLDSQKRALRKSCEASRNAIPLDDRVAAAAGLAAAGIGFARLPSGAAVSAYSAMGSEIDPLPLVHQLAEKGYQICLPVIPPLGNPLLFRGWRPGESLVARTWGIREPKDDAPLIEPDLLLVPLLAFDRHGVRLGYGGGYYDRTLEQLRGRKRVIAVGLAFAEQELEHVPWGRHDQHLDWVLTPDGPIEIR